MLCEIRTFRIWSHVSQTSALAVMSLVSPAESQQYPASGPAFFAMGTDFGRFSTFLRSVFSMVKGGLLCAGMVGEEIGAETVVRVDGIEEGPGTGRACDTESVNVDKRRELVMKRCHTVVEFKI